MENGQHNRRRRRRGSASSSDGEAETMITAENPAVNLDKTNTAVTTPIKNKEYDESVENGTVIDETAKLTADANGGNSAAENKKKENDEVTTQIVWKLYLSRLLTALGDRLWMFAFGLFLFKMHNKDLRLLAFYGFAMNTSNILLLSAIGKWIDDKKRLTAARILLIIQNTCVIINCIILALFFLYNEDIQERIVLYRVLEAIVIVFAILSNLASNGSQIVVEKDWIVCIANGDDNFLAILNSNFRTIDLCCLTFAPVVAGLLFSYTSYMVVTVVLAAWNLISMVAEYTLLFIIYRDYPQLKEKPELEEEEKKQKKKNWVMDKITGSALGWKKYFTHTVRNAGLGLAFLYMTVLGFDNITWAYALLQCVPEWVLGILVAVSGFCGVAGSRTYPHLRSKLGVERSGVVGMSILVFCLTFCVLSIWLPGSPFDPLTDSLQPHANMANSTATQDYVEQKCGAADAAVDFVSVGTMLAGIIIARFGLWIADLSITQILQENVQPRIRGVIGGVQNSLNSAMDLVKFIFVFILPHENTFGILILLSYCFVSTGALFMTSYAYKKRKLCFQKENTPTAVQETDDSSEKMVKKNGHSTSGKENNGPVNV
eukprot:TRINITY_DN10310_c0_g1_i1.p1 TRINITY_DN10310_c0_g1~~TRINITY_DN10310_c0_g1_i1.p1  ORF type:complete len:602 (+),score=157.62 TRINITY_DN10310_c0_g1_i1:114-1919(+)